MARLKKLLQQDKNLREALEAGLQLPCCHLTISATNSERVSLAKSWSIWHIECMMLVELSHYLKIGLQMNADLVEILPTEADLKQQVEDLHVHILQQLEMNNGLLCGQHSQPPYRPATL